MKFTAPHTLDTSGNGQPYDALPQWARDILSATPPRGEGLNRWFLRAAIALRRCGRSERDIEETLATATVDQPLRRSEIARAIQRSAEFMRDEQPATSPAESKRTTVDDALRRQVIAQTRGSGVVDLWEQSPRRLTDDGPNAEEIVDLLFPGNPLLCCAEKLSTARTEPRSWWCGKLAQQQFIVPSPMSARTGIALEGHTSARCLANTGPRKYLVIEQDTGAIDDQAAILAHLAERAPLVAVVHSGNKSLHGWFACQDASADRIRRFFDYAVTLGADPATRPPCQLVRLPEGRRRNNQRQALLFLNTEVIR